MQYSSETSADVVETTRRHIAEVLS